MADSDEGTKVELVLEADGILREVPRGKVVQARITKIGRLSHGTDGNRATVCVVGELPDGRTVLLETTLRIFRTATDAMCVREAMEKKAGTLKG